MSYQQYYEAIAQILETVTQEEGAKIQQAADWCAESILRDGLIHGFGTGHSHMLVEEMFYRAGGLLPVNPILDSTLMLHVDAAKSSRMERLTGLAEVLIAGEPVKAGDVMFIFSNSGRNAAPVEMALAAQRRGVKVVGVTSLAHAKSVPSRHPDDLKLHDVVDLVIDNHGIPGDAVVSLAGLPVKAAATSSVVGAFIVQTIVAEVATGMARIGKQPPIMMSANLDGAEDYNQKMLEAYKARLKDLRI